LAGRGGCRQYVVDQGEAIGGQADLVGGGVLARHPVDAQVQAIAGYPDDVADHSAPLAADQGGYVAGQREHIGKRLAESGHAQGGFHPGEGGRVISHAEILGQPHGLEGVLGQRDDLPQVPRYGGGLVMGIAAYCFIMSSTKGLAWSEGLSRLAPGRKTAATRGVAAVHTGSREDGNAGCVSPGEQVLTAS
jgi:hypothetical protein